MRPVQDSSSFLGAFWWKPCEICTVASDKLWRGLSSNVVRCFKGFVSSKAQLLVDHLEDRSQLVQKMRCHLLWGVDISVWTRQPTSHHNFHPRWWWGTHVFDSPIEILSLPETMPYLLRPALSSRCVREQWIGHSCDVPRKPPKLWALEHVQTQHPMHCKRSQLILRHQRRREWDWLVPTSLQMSWSFVQRWHCL